jgi:hypothetical protein
LGFSTIALAQAAPVVEPIPEASPYVEPQTAPPPAAPAVTETSQPYSPAAEQTPPPSAVDATPAAAPATPEADPNTGVVSFKPGKGVEIKSNDGNFSLKVQLKAQLLTEVNKQKSAEKATVDYWVRRVRLALGGNVFSKDIKYKAEVTFAAAELNRVEPRTAENVIPADPMMMGSKASAATLDRDVITQSPLLDLYFDFTQLRDLSIRVGQSKVPFGRERMLSDNEMVVVDRSLADAAYNFDRDMGIDIRSSDFLGVNMLHYYLGVYAAEDRNTSFGTIGRGDLGFLYNARLEFLPFGNFEEVAADFDRKGPRLSIGAAFAYLQTDGTSPYASQSLGGTIPGTKLTAVPKVDYHVQNVTADLLFKAGGFTLMSAFHYRKVGGLPKEVTKARNGIGFVAQAGYILSESVPLEVYALFGMIRTIKKDISNTAGNTEGGGGLTYYFNKQGLKLQAELARVVWQEEADKGKNDTRFRLQLQVLL